MRAAFAFHISGRSKFPTSSFCQANRHRRFRGRSSCYNHRPFAYSTNIHASHRILPLERPPDPSYFSRNDTAADDNDARGPTEYVRNQTRILREWMGEKRSILCITGAGISTESGIPDYRGNNGSYFRGHRPIIHHEYMNSPYHRKRYWARSLVGYSPFVNAMPNMGHEALAVLEAGGYIGVDLGGCDDFDRLGSSCLGQPVDAIDGKDLARKISVITQNVDTLHTKAGVRHCLHLHGRGDLIRCMNCGYMRDRKDYHDELTRLNRDWLNGATSGVDGSTGDVIKDGRAELRPDGDAELNRGVSYDDFILPPCSRCDDATLHDNEGNSCNKENSHQERRSFFKTDVVFFGDSVPKQRFDVSHAAVDAANGILCIGTSLTVHSAYRLVKRGIERGIPVAILNVGETRVEREGLGDRLVTKLQSPIGETLNGLVGMLDQEKMNK
ncbi:hypothetical protein ACHAXA_004018 [Cyclostephanos tholiformis]|uniref:Deacetylase sirtuin-type domain-containing protein n=1 Tax=Cyclostephanos tholiformis TaxID=382380 RepID=A0ABD3S033_9STRA